MDILCWPVITVSASYSRRQKYVYFGVIFQHIPHGCFNPRAQSPFLIQWQIFQSQLLINMTHSSQSQWQLLPVSHQPHGYTHQSDCTSLVHRPITYSLPQYLGKLPLALWSAMGHSFFPTNIYHLVAEYSNQALVVASNRSAVNNEDTHVWVLFGTHTLTCAYSNRFVSGGGQALTTLWAEISGFVGGMLALDAILSTALVHITPHCGDGVLFDNMAFISQPDPNMAPSKTHWLHENLNHVFQCSQAASTCNSAWAQFLSTLQKTSTYPLIVDTLGYGISHWSTGSLSQWQGPNPGLSDNLRLLVLTVCQKQQSIGWDQAIRGHLSVHWEYANTLYCQE